jgi:hypothetical protein
VSAASPFIAQASVGKPDLWQVLILVGLGVLIWMYVRPGKKRKTDPLERGGSFASLSQQRAIEREMGNLLVELEQMARTMNAQLDTRAAKLEALIAEADGKIALLNQKRGGLDVTVNDAPLPKLRLANPELEEPNIEIAGDDGKHAEIYRLSDDGLGAFEIAKKLGRPAGEIELILALRKRA